MSLISTVDRLAGANAQIRGDLVDLLVEAVMRQPAPGDRAVVISNLLGEMYAAIEWLHSAEVPLDDDARRELASLRQLLAAGRDHQSRMTTADRVASATGGRA